MKVRMTVEQSNREAFIDRVVEKYHFSVEDRESLLLVYDKVRSYMAPYALYRINNRMRGVPLIDKEQSAIVAMTLGEGIDRLQDYYEKRNELSESYMVECLASELLLQMYAEFNQNYPKFHRRYIKRYVFIGEELPLSMMQSLLDELYGKNEESNTDKMEITANPYGVLMPSKSVVFFAILSDNPSQKCQGICQNCGNIECENHMREINQIQTRTKCEEEACTILTPQQLNYGYQRIFGYQREGK